MGPEFWLYFAVGFAAQLVDGALGMAYGVVTTTVLLAGGVTPANASASVHAAKVFTGAASAISHIAHRNVDWRLLVLLAAVLVAWPLYRLLTAPSLLPVIVPIESYKTFYPAEASHQNFMRLNPSNPYIVRWDAPKLAALKRLYPDLVRKVPAP